MTRTATARDGTTIYVSKSARDALGELVGRINDAGLRSDLSAVTGGRGLSRAAAVDLLIEHYGSALVELLTGEENEND